jgi:hypothetical protein
VGRGERERERERAVYWLVVGMQVKRKVRGEALLMHAQTTKHVLSVARTHIVLEAANIFPNRVNVFLKK